MNKLDTLLEKSDKQLKMTNEMLEEAKHLQKTTIKIVPQNKQHQILPIVIGTLILISFLMGIVLVTN